MVRCLQKRFCPRVIDIVAVPVFVGSPRGPHMPINVGWSFWCWLSFFVFARPRSVARRYPFQGTVFGGGGANLHRVFSKMFCPHLHPGGCLASPPSCVHVAFSLHATSKRPTRDPRSLQAASNEHAGEPHASALFVSPRRPPVEPRVRGSKGEGPQGGTRGRQSENAQRTQTQSAESSRKAMQPRPSDSLGQNSF